MGYRGKVDEQNRARDLRAQAWTLKEIADELGVSKSSVSLWVRGVQFDEAGLATRAQDRRNATARRRGPNKLQLRKQAEIDAGVSEGRCWIGPVDERDLLIAGTMLYAGEGAKTDGDVKLVNTDPRLVAFFCRWLRHFFDVDESRMRCRLYLHEGLDLVAATVFWSELTGIPPSQFTLPYRAVPDPSIRRSKHPLGCATVNYACSRTHRRIMGLMDALLSSGLQSGVAQLAEHAAVNRGVVGSSPTPGAAEGRRFESLRSEGDPQ
jgi:transcriptional regulator with XRE-family HTH domain